MLITDWNQYVPNTNWIAVSIVTQGFPQINKYNNQQKTTKFGQNLKALVLVKNVGEMINKTLISVWSSCIAVICM